MSIATFYFHGELNIFLPHALRSKPIEHHFDWRASIKDMVESLGPPHCEVELLVVDGVSVDFDYIVEPGTHIEVYDRFDAADLPDKVALRPSLNGRPRFVLDTHLGRLASYLRMMGFDTLYRNDYPDDELAFISHHKRRILLTRDIGLLKRSLVIYGHFMRETDPRRQLIEVLRHYSLREHVEPFRHCIKCNGELERVDKHTILDELPDGTIEFYDEFHRCVDCQQIYWKGSHYARMQDFMAQMLDIS